MNTLPTASFLSTPPPTTRIQDSEREQIAEAYRSGLTLEEVGAKFGRSPRGTVWLILKEMGVPRRPPGPAAGKTGVPLTDQVRMAELYDQGFTQQEVADELGWSHSTVWNRMKRCGVRARSRSEANRTYRLDQRCFASVDTPEKAWLLGLIASDGCVGEDVLRIALRQKDRDALEKAAVVLGYDGPIYDKPKDGGMTSTLGISSRRLCEDLLAVGIMPRKSLTLKPWDGPDHLLPHYWRGMVDGDGHLGRRRHKGSCQVWEVGLCGTLPTVKAFAAFINMRTTGSKARPQPSGKIFNMVYGGLALPKQIATLLYKDAPVFMNRKKRLADELMATPVMPTRWAHITVDDLNRLHSQFGTWVAVSKHLGMNVPESLDSLRRRLGML